MLMVNRKIANNTIPSAEVLWTSHVLFSTHTHSELSANDRSFTMISKIVTHLVTILKLILSSSILYFGNAECLFNVFTVLKSIVALQSVDKLHILYSSGRRIQC